MGELTQTKKLRMFEGGKLLRMSGRAFAAAKALAGWSARHFEKSKGV
jgi:hypothetical protein